VHRSLLSTSDCDGKSELTLPNGATFSTDLSMARAHLTI
jgi:hypothetical protein